LGIIIKGSMNNSKYNKQNSPILKRYSSSHNESVSRKPDFLTTFPKTYSLPQEI
jgi:hypothetical protein